MADLKDVFLDIGFKNVRTVLATGNVIFDSDEGDERSLTNKITSGIKKRFKIDINVLLRSYDDLKYLKSREPFSDIVVSETTRLYVTFSPVEVSPVSITIPYTSPQEDFDIINVTRNEIFTVVDISRGGGTSAAMKIIEKEFGPDITTRNWDTILKILK